MPLKQGGSSGILFRRSRSSRTAPEQPATCSTAVSTSCKARMYKNISGGESDTITSMFGGIMSGSTLVRSGGRWAARRRESFFRLGRVKIELRRGRRYNMISSVGWQVKRSLIKEGEGVRGHVSGHSRGSRGRLLVTRGQKKFLNISESEPPFAVTLFMILDSNSMIWFNLVPPTLTASFKS